MASQCRGGALFIVLTFISLSWAYAEAENQDRRAAGPTETAVDVQHLHEQDGWRVAETVNFRLLHQHSHGLAEAVLRTAERTRAAQLRKWFGEAGVDWEPKCRIYLYASGEDYGAATGAPVRWAGGHTDIHMQDGRVIGRSIHVHGSQTFVLKGVVPHEVTHAVLAGRLGSGRVPRWADEGMAVLAEAPAHIAMHLRFLPRWRADAMLYPARTLVEMRDYPEPHALGVFYAQSVSLVDFLTRQKGAARFAAFVRDGERDGYAASLRKHYGWSFAELDRRWQRYAFDEKHAAEPISGGG